MTTETTQGPWDGTETIMLAELAEEIGPVLAESIFANVCERRVGGTSFRPHPESLFFPADKGGCTHGPDRRCFDCATDEEMSAAIPPRSQS